MSYRLTVRRGPKVERSRHEALADALAELERLAGTAQRREGVEFVSRRYEPGELVALRVELKGDGAHAGLDVYGDGSAVAWTGRIRRAPVEPRPGESAVAALRRTLAHQA